MNKRTLRLIILAAVVALLLGGYLILRSVTGGGEETETAEGTKISLCTFAPADVSAISYNYNGAQLAFTCANGQWSYDGDPDFPLAQNTLTGMIESVAEVSATRQLTDAEELSSYGLDAPKLTLTITSAGADYTFALGAYTSYSSEYYMLYNDGIYTVDSTLMTSFGKNLYDYLTTTALPSLENIKSFTVDGKDITDEAAVSDLSSKFASLKLGDVADYKNKEAYGFDGTQHTVKVAYTVDTPVTDTDGSTTSTVTTEGSYTFEYAYKGETAYAMLENDELVYAITGTQSFDIAEPAETTAE